jgi:two-component system LytT family response regulator
MAIAHIIDNSFASAMLLKKKIENLTDYFDRVEPFISSFTTYTPLAGNMPDIIFTNIELASVNDKNTFDQIKQLGVPTVYVCSQNNRSTIGVREKVFDYIIQPIKEQELLDTINKFIAWKQLHNYTPVKVKDTFSEILLKQQGKLLIHTIESINLIQINQIIHVLGEDNYSIFHLQNQTKGLISSRTLKYFEQQLEAFGFIRIHKSHLVNMVFVDKVITRDGGHVHLTTNELLTFSREKKSDILDWFKR